MTLTQVRRNGANILDPLAAIVSAVYMPAAFEAGLYGQGAQTHNMYAPTGRSYYIIYCSPSAIDGNRGGGSQQDGILSQHATEQMRALNLAGFELATVVGRNEKERTRVSSRFYRKMVKSSAF